MFFCPEAFSGIYYLYYSQNVVFVNFFEGYYPKSPGLYGWILSPEVFGLMDDAVKQLRQAAYGVGTGTMTIDEAIAGYGALAQ